MSTADNSSFGAGGTAGPAGGSESLSPFPSSRLAHQQAWTSEIVISQATGAIGSNLGRSEVSPPPSVHSSTAGGINPQHHQTLPTRPARPNAQHARYDSGEAGGFGTASPAEPTSSSSPSSSHQRDLNSGPRRQPPPLPDSPPYEGQRSTTLGGGAAANSEDAAVPGQSQFWPSTHSSSLKGDGISPQRRPYPGSFKDRQWVSQDAGSQRSPTTSPASSSHANNTTTSATTSPPHSPGEVVGPPLALPPRDYKRRESAPARPAMVGSNLPCVDSSPSTLANSRLQPAYDPTDRRQSDSSSSSLTNTSGSLVASSGPNSQTLSLQPASLSPSHSRQPSQEELECDQQALVLAQHLAGQGADQKLSEVLRLDTNKKRMQFMDGLFSQSQPALNTQSFDGPLPVSDKSSVSAVPSTATCLAVSGSAPSGISTPHTTTSPANGSAAVTRVLAQNGNSSTDTSSDHSQRYSYKPDFDTYGPLLCCLSLHLLFSLSLILTLSVSH